MYIYNHHFNKVTMNSTTISLWILFFAITATEIEARVEFTNIKCEPLDKAFADFDYCYIKAVNRSYKYISLKVNLFKIPVTKIKANFCLMKRFNGYKPFLYNVTFDGCKYFENNGRNPIAQYLAGIFQPYINMNHCPLDENIVLDKLPIDYVNNHFTNVLPFPHGDYALFSRWYAYDINRADVKVFFTLS